MKVLILSPHPDDMEYNMGGTVIKLRDKKWRVDQMIFSDCIELVGDQCIKGALLSSKQLGINMITKEFLNQEFITHRSEIREEIFDLSKNHYDVVFVPCRQDWHQDHQVVTQEAIRIFRKNTTILGYIKDEIYEKHHDLKVDLTKDQVDCRIQLLALFHIYYVKPINPEWFEVIQLRNYL